MAQDNAVQLSRQAACPARVLLWAKTRISGRRRWRAFPRVELTTAEDWRGATLEAYDVYAFDGCLPEKLPQDGAVWLLNRPRSPREVGVVLGERLMGAYVKGARTDTELGERLTRGLVLRDAAVARFREMTAQGGLENVLLCGEMPVMAAGTNANGCLQAVLPFDIQESNLPLLPDFVVLVNNMLEASAPTLLDAETVDCGTRVYPQPHPLCSRLFLQTPDMRLEALDPGAGGRRRSRGQPRQLDAHAGGARAAGGAFCGAGAAGGEDDADAAGRSAADADGGRAGERPGACARILSGA